MFKRNGIHLLRAELTDLARQETAIASGISLRWVDPDDRQLIVDSPHRPHRRTGPQFLERHYRDGGRACAASLDGDFVAWRLFKPGSQRYGNWMEIHCSERALFGMAAFTAPHMRGNRLMRSLTAFAAREYLSSGYTTMFAIADFGNARARAAHSAIGMQDIGSMAWIRWPFRIRTIRINGNLTVGRFRDGRPLIHHVA